MQNYTLLLDDVMEEHTQALFLCVSVCGQNGRSGSKGVTGKAADEGVGDAL